MSGFLAENAGLALTMANFGTHAALLAPQFTTTLARLLNTHDRPRVQLKAV
jgi:hypothetical protein